MAGSSFHWKLATLWLDSGQSWHMWWNNAYYDRVYSCNNSPIVDGPDGSVAQAEVMRLWRTHSRMPTKSEAEVHVDLKNVGNSAAFCYIFMSAIGP
jgi:hypothetical protein